ncbi:MAG: hypothetical protein M1836_005279 [Candelina mexicana]|nr:MAG: hypothetical protein M1836_005279 [Candelina mexicana]
MLITFQTICSLFIFSDLFSLLSTASPVDNDKEFVPSPRAAALSPPTVSAISSNTIIPYYWSKDAKHCSTTACFSDCQSAIFQLCSSPNLAQPLLNVTVNACTALYMYDSSTNALPSQATCLANYYQILAASKQPFSRCGGAIGGAIGYLKDGTRADHSPLYTLFDTKGNGNCFKPERDETRVLEKGEVVGGGIVPACRAVTTARRTNLLDGKDLEGNDGGEIQRRQTIGQSACSVANIATNADCTAACLQVVTTTSYTAGPLALAAGLACLGACASIALAVASQCMDSQNSLIVAPGRLSQRVKRGDKQDMLNPCVMINSWDWGQCSATKSAIQTSKACTVDGQARIQY